jgi:hypothetical protein
VRLWRYKIRLEKSISNIEHFDGMTLNLSNFISKVYLKKDNKIAFHLRTHLIIESEYYRPSRDLKKYSCFLILKDGSRIDFDKSFYIDTNTDFDYSFSGKAKVIQLQFQKVMEYRALENAVTEIEFRCQFREVNYIPEKEHVIKTFGLLQKMYDERYFND